MAQGKTRARSAARAVVVLAGVAAVTIGASTASPPAESRYTPQLRQVTAQVEASLREIMALDRDSPTLVAAGGRLAATAGAGCRVLRLYQGADTRYGTPEEVELVRGLQRGLDQAVQRFGGITGVTPAQATAKQRSTAEQLVRRLAAGAAGDAIAEWVGDEQLAAVLTSGNIAQVRSGLERELTRRIDAEARSISQRALGLSLSLNAPLRTQVASQLDQAALRWLAKTVLRWDATGLAIQLVGVPIVRFLRSELQEAFRDHRHVTERTDRTITGFEARAAELQRLVGAADSSSLDRVRRTLARVQRALDATHYLKSDLRKQGRNDLLARLATAEAALKSTMRETRATFLLDSALTRAVVVQAADRVCRQQREVARMTSRGVTCADGLGLEWREHEVGFTGTWTRASCTAKTWAATWVGGCNRSSVVVSRSGDTVTARRTDACTFSPDFAATYTGTVRGRTISGTEACRCTKAFPCSGTPRTWTQSWSAKIVR